MLDNWVSTDLFFFFLFFSSSSATQTETTRLSRLSHSQTCCQSLPKSRHKSAVWSYWRANSKCQVPSWWKFKRIWMTKEQQVKFNKSCTVIKSNFWVSLQRARYWPSPFDLALSICVVLKAWSKKSISEIKAISESKHIKAYQSWLMRNNTSNLERVEVTPFAFSLQARSQLFPQRTSRSVSEKHVPSTELTPLRCSNRIVKGSSPGRSAIACTCMFVEKTLLIDFTDSLASSVYSFIATIHRRLDLSLTLALLESR